MLDWIESTTLAVAVRDSLAATALLSGLHAASMVLATGAALVRGLHWNNRAQTRAVRVGVLLSVISGALLVAPRAAAAVANNLFRAKMLVLAAAVATDWMLFSSNADRQTAMPLRMLAALLLVAVAALGCAFILLE